VFRYLSSQSTPLIYDLSFILSSSDTVNLVEFGYNAEGVWLPQVNIALFSAMDAGLPVMIRTLPGSVREVSTLGDLSPRSQHREGSLSSIMDLSQRRMKEH